MVWNTLDNHSAGDLITESHMDDIRENIEYLFDPNMEIDTLASVSTTSTSYVDTGLQVTITSNGGLLTILFAGRANLSAVGGEPVFRLLRDATELEAIGPMGTNVGVGIVYAETQAAASYTYKVQIKRNGGSNTAYLYDAQLIVKEA